MYVVRLFASNKRNNDQTATFASNGTWHWVNAEDGLNIGAAE